MCSLPDGFNADEVAARMPDAPEVWTDGSLVLDQVTGVSAAGLVSLLTSRSTARSAADWGHVDHVST